MSEIQSDPPESAEEPAVAAPPPPSAADPEPAPSESSAGEQADSSGTKSDGVPEGSSPSERDRSSSEASGDPPEAVEAPKTESAPNSEPEDRSDSGPGNESSRAPSENRGSEPNRDGRSRRDSSKRREGDDQQRRGGERREGDDQQRRGRGGRPQRNRRGRKDRRKEREEEREREAALLEAAPAVEMQGLIEISPKGFGFLRQRELNYQQSPEDVFITPEVVRIHGLRDGVWVKCLSKKGVRGPQLVEVLEINGREPEAYHNLPYFEELTAINPNKRLKLETTSDRHTTRVIDLMTPVGRGQRGLIVAPPRTGKTTLLHHIADAIQENYEDEHLMVMLIDERPEEVTDFKRSFPEADIFASSNDSDIKSHTRMAQLAIERAKRLVEAGENVFILLDSITRMARAFNNSTGGGKNRGTQSGGIAVGALEIPRRLFAAARNTREAGALTVIATALIQTNSRMDEAIFQEFKGTGNLELVLDRQLSQNYVYPSVDIHKSGTRREELLLPGHQLEKIHVIRRGLAGYKPLEAMEWLLNAMGKYPSNAQMLMDIKTSAVA